MGCVEDELIKFMLKVGEKRVSELGAERSKMFTKKQDVKSKFLSR